MICNIPTIYLLHSQAMTVHRASLYEKISCYFDVLLAHICSNYLTGGAISIFLVIIFFLGYEDASCTCCGANGMTSQKTVILTALFIYIGGYQVGFGPISWLLISEIFPLEVRGKAVALAVLTNFLWNTVVAFLFPVELEYIGSSSTFFIYAAVLVVSVVFIYRKVPETKGMSLEQIEEFFVHSSKPAANAKILI